MASHARFSGRCINRFRWDAFTPVLEIQWPTAVFWHMMPQIHEKVYLWSTRKCSVVDFPVDCNLQDQYPDITGKISAAAPQSGKNGNVR
jgi:hypothetical protein